MSYILDALRKAERERELVKVPTIETVHELPQRRRTGVWLAVGAAAVLCLAVAMFFLFRDTAETRLASSGAEAQGTQDIQNLNVADRGQPAVAPPTVPEPTAEPLSPAPALANIATDAQVSERETRPVQAVQATPVPEQVAPPAPLRTPAPGAVPTTPFRDVVKSMIVSVHLYSDDKDERMVFIDGRKYLEGDGMTADCVVESITPEGVMLRRGDERVTLRPGAAPIFH
jgi:general secretion pathway protein B